MRAGNAFGFDLLANFDLTFIRKGKTWAVADDLVIESDFNFAGSEESEGSPLAQQYAWFWEKNQKIPHVIDDSVFDALINQVKVSSFLFLKTDPNELLLMTDVPNQQRAFRAMTAVIDTDWYPASYPWHVVLELDPREKKIEIKKGEALARLIPVRRDTYFARQMTPPDFDEFFTRGQKWLGKHGKPHEGEVMDLTHTYVKQQLKSRFVTL